MADSKMKMNSNLHIAMYPWLAFGHFLSFLHLSNKLAKRGNKVSLLFPRGVVPRLAKLNKFPHLIRFIPLIIPHVDGLPLGAETLSEIPVALESHLCTAMDQTQDQVRAILSTIKPDIVLFDCSYWIPNLGKELGFKSVLYLTTGAAVLALTSLPLETTIGGLTLEDIMKTDSSFSNIFEEFGKGTSFMDRLNIGLNESTALGVRTCYEMEPRFVDQLVNHFTKPFLLTGPVLPEKPEQPLQEKWENWLNKFDPGSVVFCSFGSQTVLAKSQFQELLLAFERTGLPFLAVLSKPNECQAIEEALPEGFKERVKERGLVYGGWVPQDRIVSHRSIGCFVSHGGPSSIWESLASNCQIVIVPPRLEQVALALLMAEELKVAIRVKKEENGLFSKESVSDAIVLAMSTDNEVAKTMKANHDKWRRFLLDNETEEKYLDTLIKDLHDLF